VVKGGEGKEEEMEDKKLRRRGLEIKMTIVKRGMRQEEQTPPF
jgi:hypothetical protein